MEAYIDLISRPEGHMDLNAVPEPAGGGVVLTDTTPYLYRISADGQNIGSQEFDEIVGGTIAWNQFIGGEFYANGCTASTSSGVTTITPTASDNRYTAYKSGTTTPKIPVIKDHVYLQTVIIKSDGTNQVGFQNYLYLTFAKKTTSAEFVTLYAIGKATDTGDSTIQLWSPSETVYQIKEGSFMLFDLTLMFGSTIADYINSLETANTGDGVAYFKSLFPNDFYAYDSGTLMSVQTSEHKMVGFNQFDGEWELGGYSTGSGQKTTRNDSIRCKNPIHVLPNTTYYFHCGSHSTTIHGVWLWYDSNDNYIGAILNRLNRTETSPSNAAYLRFYVAPETTYNNDICINISDASKNGTYEPYISHSYPLDSSLTLRGIPKLVDNKLTYDGDIYQSDGTVTRKYRIVDLGTLDWNYGNGLFSCGFRLLNAKYRGYLICTRYQMKTVPLNPTEDKIMYMANSEAIPILRVSDFDYTDAATFKTAMNGVYLVYELATSTTETATPYTNPQIVANGGTEEYVDTRSVPIPVGHNTKYQGVLL